jgi:hypothetical protein
MQYALLLENIGEDQLQQNMGLRRSRDIHINQFEITGSIG